MPTSYALQLRIEHISARDYTLLCSENTRQQLTPCFVYRGLRDTDFILRTDHHSRGDLRTVGFSKEFIHLIKMWCFSGYTLVHVTDEESVALDPKLPAYEWGKEKS